MPHQEPNSHPLYVSFEDYLHRTPWPELRRRVIDIAKRANRDRLLSKTADDRVTALQVWHVLSAAKGRCMHCGSLAVESRPSNPRSGSPIKWEQVGRRVGSFEHIRGRFHGGGNDFANLAWSCLFCNNWTAEAQRKRGLSARGSTDRGGYYPDLSIEPDATECELIVAAGYVKSTGKAWSAEEAFMIRPKSEWLDDDADYGFEMFPDHECPWDIRMDTED